MAIHQKDSRTIWKFPVLITDDITVVMPAGARVLCVQEQFGAPCLWALVDPKADVIERQFQWRGTGHPCDDIAAGAYVGTIQMHGGDLVFHLFEREGKAGH